jgi:hypothetical protein
MCWIASTTVDGKKLLLGEFAREEAAAVQYDEAAQKHHGARAKPNFRESISSAESIAIDFEPSGSLTTRARRVRCRQPSQTWRKQFGQGPKAQSPQRALRALRKHRTTAPAVAARS